MVAASEGGEERGHFGRAERVRVLQVVVVDEAADPVAVGFFGPGTEVAAAAGAPELVEKAWGGAARCASGVSDARRLPAIVRHEVSRSENRAVSLHGQFHFQLGMRVSLDALTARDADRSFCVLVQTQAAGVVGRHYADRPNQASGSRLSLLRDGHKG